MATRTSIAALLGLVMLLGLAPAAAADTPLPDSMAAVGDSITQAASSGGSLGADYPQNSWSTGSNATVNSHYLRLAALNPAISAHATNLSVSGAKMADLQGQMQQAAALQRDYVTVLIGGNDICTDTEAQMTSVADFRAQFEAAMAELTASPGTTVYVVSIPRVLGLWELFRNDWWARFIWSVGDICQSLLANPTSTQTADVQRRARVAQRNVDFNQVLVEVCDAAPSCHWDGLAAYGTSFTRGDVSADYFHPSIAGQAKLAAVSWAAGPWAAPPNAAPVASFGFACTELACSFDGSASTDGDGTIVSYAWTFGDGGSASGATTSHGYAATGTYPVTLTVTDDDGAQASQTQAVSVASAGGGTVTLGALSGTSGTRKGGWTATVSVTALDGNGDPVSSAIVSGMWSTGASGGCTTAANGSCSFSLNLGRKVASARWTISTISHATLSYVPGALSSVTINAP